MLDHASLTIAGIIFICFAFLAFTSYMRMLMYLQALDAGLENPPERPHIGDKLRAYKEFCKDRNKTPFLLVIFSIGVIGAVLSWLPLPWLVFR